jgi:hypothetical protein
VTEWHAADEPNRRDKIDRARQAAEALFKPVREGGQHPQAAVNTTGSTEQQPQRQPRIFAVRPQMSATAEAEATAKSKPAARKPTTRRRSTVPPSQIARVRALATYGMTTAQLAELYDVTVDEIERLLGGSAVNRKPR